MAELSSLPTQNSGPTGIVDSREHATHLAGLWVPHTAALKAKSGFRPGPGSSPGVVTATGTPDGFVHVAAFNLVLQNVRGSGFGVYMACLDATKDINILSTPADPTNPRDDLIIAQQSDIFDSDANSDFIVKQVVGTPAVSPTDPAVSGSTNYVTLARVRVNANATTITSGNITDLRTSGHAKSLTGGLHTVGLGGLLPAASLAQRDALTGLYDGLAVWRSDLDAINVYNGAGWRYFSRYSEASVATSQTTTSTTYADLATVGPAVTIETGNEAEVILKGSMSLSGGNAIFMSFAVSGATTQAAADDRAVRLVSTVLQRASTVVYVFALTPGINTFTAKYKVDAGTGTFVDRTIDVKPT